MKAPYTVIFVVVIIFLHLSGSAVPLDAVKEIQSEKTEKMSLTSLAGENLHLSIFNKESVHQSGKLCYNSLEEVKLNGGIGNEKVTFSHFYQHIGDSAGKAWNVSTIHVLMFFKYLSFGLAIDRGDFTDHNDKLWTSNLVHRLGVELGQSYVNNDSTFFSVKVADEKYFPGLSFKMGYYWSVTRSVIANFEIHGVIFDTQNAYTATSLAFTKKYCKHELTIKPYWSASKYGKLNLILSDKFYLQQKQGYLSFQCITGYFPNDNTFIDYNTITKQRFFLSADGLFKIPETRTMIHIACGVDYLKGNNGSFDPNWFVQLGIVVKL